MAKRDDDIDLDALGLTQEERAALDEGDAEAQAQEAAAEEERAKLEAGEGAKADEPAAAAEADDKAAAETNDAKADEPAAEADDKAAAATAAANDAAAATAASAATAEAATGSKPDAAWSQPVPQWRPPADAEAKINAIESARIELAKKFDAGEISAEELFTEQARLNRQERAIEYAVERAEMAAEMRLSAWEQVAVPAFLERHSAYKGNETLLTILHTEVKRQQVLAEQEGRDPLHPSILTAAHDEIRKAMGAFGVEPPAAKPAAAKPAAATARQAVPPNLGSLPSAEVASTGSRFAYLDRMADANPLAFEEALARLSDAEREAYLSSAH